MKIAETMSQIKRWNELYRAGNPEVSDQVYDDTLDKLESVLPFDDYMAFTRSLHENPGKVKHNHVIGSLKKIKAEDPKAFDEWVNKVNVRDQILEMEKIDGASIVLHYVKGILVSATTRGDGEYGEDQTEKFQYIQPTCDENWSGEVRAEVTFTHATFIEFKKFDPEAKNLRNSTVGLLNTDEIDPKKLSLLKVIAYQILSGEGSELPRINQLEKLQNELGFRIPRLAAPSASKPTIEAHLKHWKATADYMIDGAVICPIEYVAENVYHPEEMVAFKTRSDEALTKVKGIEWNISKDGLLKPVVLLEPCELDGTTVQRASGYNLKYLLELGLNIGDEVNVYKGGDIIPVVEKVVNKHNDEDLRYPLYCPECDGETRFKGVDLVCTNKKCRVRVLKETESFLWKLEVEGVSNVSLQAWNIWSPEELIDWRPDPKYKSQTKFYQEVLEKVFRASELDLTACLNYEGAGRKTIKKVVDFYTMEGIDKMAAHGARPTEFPEGVGDLIMKKILKHWSTNRQFVRDIMEDQRYEKPEEKVMGGNLMGKSFCFTGKISQPRKVYEQMVKDNGGEVKSVSKNLDYLVVGEKAGSKLDKAQKLGVTILDEAQFNSMVG